MQTFFSFNFLQTITEQLSALLESLEISSLSPENLTGLSEYQRQTNSVRGVYLIHLDGKPAYCGKARNVVERLAQHLETLSGRVGINVQTIGYKAILLDPSMSTAANEELLIETFRQRRLCDLNGTGFGGKDPGQNRDHREPSVFDRTYPIDLEWEITGIDDLTTVGSLLSKIKNSLPYLFRFQRLSAAEKSIPIDLTSHPRRVRDLLPYAEGKLGEGWKAVAFKSHVILYRTGHEYSFGERMRL